MSEAPERIWIEDEFGDGDEDQWTYGTWDVRNYRGYDVEYIRADIVQTLTAERDRMAMSCLSADGEAQRAWDAQKAAEAERDAAKAKVERLGREVNVAKYGQPDFAWSVHLEVMAELQADAARLREALDAVNAKWRSGAASTLDEVRGLALAEAAILDLIEGGTHD